jgi:hypothetical protein
MYLVYFIGYLILFAVIWLAANLLWFGGGLGVIGAGIILALIGTAINWLESH